MGRCGRWIKTRCCGTTLHVDFNREPTHAEIQEIAAGPCWACRQRAEMQQQEQAAGLLVPCQEHGETPLCYVLPDGSHADSAACRCRFRHRDDCPVPAHLEVARGRDAGWNERRREKETEGR